MIHAQADLVAIAIKERQRSATAIHNLYGHTPMHSALGYGAHRCIGAPLARSEAHANLR